ncbi:MAG: HAD family hydrolase [Balneolaceae bacterium]
MANNETDLLKEQFIRLSKPLDPQPTGEEPRLIHLKGIGTIVFDFYGTLFMSGVGDIGIDEENRDPALFTEVFRAAGLTCDESTGAEALKRFETLVKEQQETLKERGIKVPEPDMEEIWTTLLRQLGEDDLLDGDTEEETARTAAVEFEARVNPAWPMPGLDEMLRRLDEPDTELGIISNSQFYTPLLFEALTKRSIPEMGFNPNLLHWSWEEGMKKPSLNFYRRFLRRLPAGTDPSSVLYVGNDMLKDIWPASVLGMKTALFAGDSRSLKWRRDDDRCHQLKPDLVVTELSQIPECLGIS